MAAKVYDLGAEVGLGSAFKMKPSSTVPPLANSQ
jgi:hypothetical protein